MDTTSAGGWGDFATLARDAGLGIAILVAIYRAIGPWVARTLERQHERLALADGAALERLQRAEAEAERLRERELELVAEVSAERVAAASARAEAVAAQATVRDAEAQVREARAAAQVAEQDRDAARVNLEALRQRLAACQAENGRLRSEADGGN